MFFEGKVESGGQEHLYLETQGAYAVPLQNMTASEFILPRKGPQQCSAPSHGVLGVGMNQVEVDVTRLGGGFGGKEDQASTWGAFVALVAHVLKRPAKCIPHRMEDMRMTGKRNPYSSDFKIGLDTDLHIMAYRSDILPEWRRCGRSFAGYPGTHTFPRRQQLCHSTRPGHGAFLQNQSATQYGVSRFRRAAGQICHRIGHRLRCQKPGYSPGCDSTKKTCWTTATNFITGKLLRARKPGTAGKRWNKSARLML